MQLSYPRCSVRRDFRRRGAARQVLQRRCVVRHRQDELGETWELERKVRNHARRQNLTNDSGRRHALRSGLRVLGASEISKKNCAKFSRATRGDHRRFTRTGPGNGKTLGEGRRPGGHLRATDADLRRAFNELSRITPEVLAVVCDIRDKDQSESFIDRVTSTFGGLDVLVNNAGIIQVGPLECMTLEDFENAMATHFWGPLYLMRAALPHMSKSGKGKIVNIASVGGEISVPHLVPYSASKSALVGLSGGSMPSCVEAVSRSRPFARG